MFDRKLPIWFLALIIAVLGQTVTAAELRTDHPQEYVVVKGDTLWDISARFFADPWNWPSIWHINPQVKNPHLIYPGDILALVYVDGKPMIKRVKYGKRTVKLSPKARPLPLDRAIATVPYDAVRQFLTRTRMVLTKEELDAAPYIVDTMDKHLITGSGSKIYVRGFKSYEERLDFSIYRAGDAYKDPDSEEVLGYEAIYLGESRMLKMADPASLKVTRAKREILHGDRLLPSVANEVSQNFFPHAPDFPLRGKIISVVDGVSQIGQYQTVVLNVGERQGAEAGHVLGVFQTGGKTRDTFHPEGDQIIVLPEEKAGVVMIFRTFQNLSYALVMSATRAMNLYDTVTNP